MTDLFEEPTAPAPKAAKAKAPKAAKPAPETKAEEVKDLAVVEEVRANPIAVFTDAEKFSAFRKKLEDELGETPTDVSTGVARDVIRSLAFRVVKAKTTLDKAGLGLTEDARATIAAVNATRATIKDELTALAAKVRQPLTDWEEAEAARNERIQAVIDKFRADQVVGEEDTAASVEERGRAVYEVSLDPEEFQDRLDEAQAAKDAAVLVLIRARDRLRDAEKAAAELEELRRERDERIAREAEEAAERERLAMEERVKAEAEAARIAEEEAKAAAAKAAEEAEAQRVKDAAEAAAKEAREAEAKAAREREEERERELQKERDAAAERERQLQTDRDAEKARADEAARVAQAEIDRLAEAERVRQAEEKRLADEQAERDRDAKHKTAVKTAVKEALMEHATIDQIAARKVVTAIIAGEIPNVTLKF